MVKEITCKDCWSYGELHSSCDKVRNFEVSENSPACKDIKYVYTCSKDYVSYGDTHSSCAKVRDLDVSSKSLACKDIKICKATIEALKELKAELEYANTINEDISINSLTNTPDIVSCEEQGPVKKLVSNNK